MHLWPGSFACAVEHRGALDLGSWRRRDGSVRNKRRKWSGFVLREALQKAQHSQQSRRGGAVLVCTCGVWRWSQAVTSLRVRMLTKAQPDAATGWLAG